MRRITFLCALAASVVAIAGCSASAAPSARPAHDVEGAAAATEVPAPAAALVVTDRDGEVILLDLESEERTVIAEANGSLVIGGGRFVHLVHERTGGTVVDVLDTGRWTVPHGDHTHSYRAEPREIGSVAGKGRAEDVRIGVGQASTVVRFGDGELVSFPHDAEASDVGAVRADRLGGDIALTAATAASPVLPFADHLLVAGRDAIAVLDETGFPTGEPVPCAATDADLTRVGAVFACAHGTVLFTRQTGGEIAAESIPIPAGAAPVDLAGRPDRPDLAGVAPDGVAWLLDVRQRAWTALPSDIPLLRAVALGDDASRTVAIDRDGRLRVLGPDGAVLQQSERLLARPEQTTLLVDAHRAYVGGPGDSAVREVDLTTAQIVRTFDGLDPQGMQLVG